MRIAAILLFVAMAAVAIVVLVGVWGFYFDRPWYRRHANNLMRARVALQLVAALLLGFLFVTQS